MLKDVAILFSSRQCFRRDNLPSRKFLKLTHGRNPFFIKAMFQTSVCWWIANELGLVGRNPFFIKAMFQTGFSQRGDILCSIRAGRNPFFIKAMFQTKGWRFLIGGKSFVLVAILFSSRQCFRQRERRKSSRATNDLASQSFFHQGNVSDLNCGKEFFKYRSTKKVAILFSSRQCFRRFIEQHPYEYWDGCRNPFFIKAMFQT